MLSKAQVKLIKSLHTKKGREKAGQCLVEGKKVVETAGDLVDFTFVRDDWMDFDNLVTTETPQDMAAVARIPKWETRDIENRDTIVVLDGVQDPGNVGSILRLCLGFNASLVLVNSVDVSNSKVVRSSVGAMFHVPWVNVSSASVTEVIEQFNRPVYRLEKNDNSVELTTVTANKLVLVAGSEGRGLISEIKGASVYIEHDKKLESLNVGHAVAIALYHLTSK